MSTTADPTTTSPTSPVRLGPDEPYFSPTLAELRGTETYPDPLPICANCPASDWYLTSKALRCICQALNAATWEAPNSDPVKLCDARVRAIQIEKQQLKQRP